MNSGRRSRSKGRERRRERARTRKRLVLASGRRGLVESGWRPLRLRVRARRLFRWLRAFGGPAFPSGQLQTTVRGDALSPNRSIEARPGNRPMIVAAHHLIWTAYGWWLPNDPRGSSSKEFRVEPIAELGDLHYGRKAVQPSPEELRDFHQRARAVLAHPVLLFDEQDVAIFAESFASTIRERRYTCYACAIMPEHVHLLIRKHRDWAETILESFQNDSRNALIAADRRRGNHPVW